MEKALEYLNSHMIVKHRRETESSSIADRYNWVEWDEYYVSKDDAIKAIEIALSDIK